MSSKVVLFNYPNWKQSDGDAHIVVIFKRHRKVKNFKSMHMYFACCVLKTLFQCCFDVVMSAVLVINSPGWLIRLPPVVIRMRCGSSFWGQKSTTVFAYVANLLGGMFLTSFGVITNMALVPTVLSFLSP